MYKPSTVFLTVSQAAEILSVSFATVREYARKGIIPARKIGKYWRFLEVDLLQAGDQNFAALRNRPIGSAAPVLRPRDARMAKGRVAEIARRLRQQMNLGQTSTGAQQMPRGRRKVKA